MIPADPHALLERIFGYTAFRGDQLPIIETLTEGQDALVIMPTGGGKSLCYQIPALIRPGTAIVVSPLIALMKDQVDGLCQLGVKAGLLNSSLSWNQIQDTERALLNHQLDLVYIAPERLLQQRTLNLFAQINVSLIAIDEAHCVSQWGHDFRADYLRLNQLKIVFPEVPRVALTATADARTRNDIISGLELNQAKQFISSFDRPNIQYRITHKTSPRNQLLRFIQQEHEQDSGIVYCMSRAKVEQVASALSAEGYNALPYHAGLDSAVRQRHQDRFLREERIIMVATIAFGMGIDKPDVRFVAHLDLPKSIEAYYQETGRAGRDGLPATAWLCYGLQDVIKLRQMMASSNGSEIFKRGEKHKLDAMLALCETTVCRRKTLLNYFGEETSEQCGNCDACLNPAKTWDGTEAARKALSCVFRTEQIFGVNHLIDVLRGSNNEKIKQFGHQRLSTYGIGKELSGQQWRSLFRQLVALGYLSVDVDGYGGLQLTELSRPLLKGEQSLYLREDNQKAPTRQQHKQRQANLKGRDLELWESLKELRKQFAEAQGVPPYLIFHDATLMELVRFKPTSEQRLLSINGIGAGKQQRYGKEFIELIEEFT